MASPPKSVTSHVTAPHSPASSASGNTLPQNLQAIGQIVEANLPLALQAVQISRLLRTINEVSGVTYDDRIHALAMGKLGLEPHAEKQLQEIEEKLPKRCFIFTKDSEGKYLYPLNQKQAFIDKIVKMALILNQYPCAIPRTYNQRFYPPISAELIYTAATLQDTDSIVSLTERVVNHNFVRIFAEKRGEGDHWYRYADTVEGFLEEGKSRIAARCSDGSRRVIGANERVTLIPPEFTDTSLEELSLSSHFKRMDHYSFEPVVTEFPHLPLCFSHLRLKSLLLEHLKCTSLPPEIWTQTELETLIIRVSLAALPDEMNQLKKLKKLAVDGIGAYPDFDLPLLESLEIHDPIKVIPDAIANYPLLKTLDIEGAKGLIRISPKIQNCTKLEEIFCHPSHLSLLPLNLQYCMHLTTIRSRWPIEPECGKILWTAKGGIPLSDFLAGARKAIP